MEPVCFQSDAAWCECKRALGLKWGNLEKRMIRLLATLILSQVLVIIEDSNILKNVLQFGKLT